MTQTLAQQFRTVRSNRIMLCGLTVFLKKCSIFASWWETFPEEQLSKKKKKKDHVSDMFTMVRYYRIINSFTTKAERLLGQFWLKCKLCITDCGKLDCTVFSRHNNSRYTWLLWTILMTEVFVFTQKYLNQWKNYLTHWNHYYLQAAQYLF